MDNSVPLFDICSPYLNLKSSTYTSTYMYDWMYRVGSGGAHEVTKETHGLDNSEIDQGLVVLQTKSALCSMEMPRTRSYLAQPS